MTFQTFEQAKHAAKSLHNSSLGKICLKALHIDDYLKVVNTRKEFNPNQVLTKDLLQSYLADSMHRDQVFFPHKEPHADKKKKGVARLDGSMSWFNYQ